MRYLLLAALIFLIGMLFTALPSREQRRLARLRAVAFANGLQVQIDQSTGPASIELLDGQAAWLKPLPPGAQRRSWRLLPVGSLNSLLPEAQSAVPGTQWRLPGWVQQGQTPALADEAVRELALLLAKLPEDTDALGAVDDHWLVVWREQGEDAEARAVVALLDFLARQTA